MRPVDFEAVFRRDYARIARLVARVIADHDRAEDLAVEAFWRLSRHPQAHGAAAAGWVYGVDSWTSFERPRDGVSREALASSSGMPMTKKACVCF